MSGTCGNDDSVGGILLTGSLNGMVIHKRSLRIDKRDTRCGEYGCNGLAQLLHDTVLAGNDVGKRELRFHGLQSECGCISHLTRSLSRTGKGLGGDTSHIKTCATEMTLLEDSHRLAFRGCVCSGTVSTRTAAYNDNV